MAKVTSGLQTSTKEVQLLEVQSFCLYQPFALHTQHESRNYPYNCSSMSSLYKELQLLHRSGISDFLIQNFSLKIENKINNSSLLASHLTLHLKDICKGMSNKRMTLFGHGNQSD